MGMFELADTALGRAGEGAAFMAEQFRFDHAVGNGAAVQRHEGMMAARPEIMQATATSSLPVAGLAMDQHGDVGGGQIQDVAAQRIDRRGGADQPPGDFGPARDLAAQPRFSITSARFSRARRIESTSRSGAKGFSMKS